MIYIIAFLGGYFLFSLPCIFRYFRQSARIHDLEETVHQDNIKIKQLHIDLTKSEQAVMHIPPPRPAPSPAANPSPELDELKEKYKKSLLELELMSNKLANLEHILTVDLRQYTWGDLWKMHGGKKVFDLSSLDIEAIHYPTLRKDKLFYAPYKGKRFHAVSWCYSLDGSRNVLSFTYGEALQKNYSSCPICVQIEQLARIDLI